MTHPRVSLQGRILVLEGDEDIARLLEICLARQGFEVTLAGSPQNAIEVFSEASHDLLLADFDLPELPQSSLQRAVEAAGGTLLATLRDPGPGAALAALRSGAWDVLHKPFDHLELLSARVRRAAEYTRIRKERDQLRNGGPAGAPSRDEIDDADDAGLNSISGVDALTGLPNQRAASAYFRTEAARARRFGRALCLARGSVDGLEALLQSDGRKAVDGTLRGIANLLSSMVRDMDFVARQQGGEFVLLFPETPKEMGAVVLERIRAAIEQTAVTIGSTAADNRVPVRISFGIAGLPSDGDDVSAVEGAALYALQRAQQIGNRVVVYGEGS